MLHGIAAQHRDIGVAIERGDVDCDFQAVERGLVLGVEKPRIAHGHDRRLAAAFKRRAFERERALFGETPAMFGRLRPRQQHGVTQMHPGRGMGEDMRQQQALIDLGAVLVALFQAVFARQLLVVGHQTRQQRRRIADQMLDADEFREIMRQAAIDRFGMAAQKIFPCRPVALQDRGGGGCLRRGARGLARQFSQQFGADPPLPREILGIAPVIAGHSIVAGVPGRDRRRRQAGAIENIRAVFND